MRSFPPGQSVVSSVWSPSPAANASSGTVRCPEYTPRLDSVPQVPGEPTFPDTIFHIPWIAYLSAPLAAGIELTPEILTERTPDGGLLMTATTERLDPTNPEHVRRARILAETMIACTGYRSS